ncbi:zinc-dependent metalloprotease [Aquimarina sp. AU58]|uniref:zinc-dependent metalloprotease n=1 Tax=Aquimarina sp. AU58 TaxID=1874112 RepID=UPI000D6E9C4D|nr:M43 family zinc metalloprotease [Aquimarina sp. AU58]
MKNLKFVVLTVLILFISKEAFSQKIVECKASEMNEKMINKSKKAKAEYLQFENFTKEFISSEKVSKSRAVTYIIPVVFHVFGTDFSGTTVNRSKIERALDELNKEFQGRNDDFNTVDSRFRSIRGKLDIEFRLAKKDPSGNATTGVKFHGARSGFGNDDTYDSQIRQFAWDNYKYMNVYIQSDLYNDGTYTNSGVAWYPNTGMSNNNTARVVYNGRYLYGNTNEEFAAVLTHEFGHWLNLIHTHEGGCNGTDRVSDTPQDTQSNGGGCSETSDCGRYINYENYMGYNGASGCYKMYTEGQISRMLAALQHSARKPLWQRSNLIATGVIDGGGGDLPAIPVGLRESNVTSTSFTALWNSVSTATSYDIQLWIEENGNADEGYWETQGNTSQTSYDFSRFPANSTQWWRVRANNSEGSSSYSDYRTVELSGGGGGDLPATPAGLSESNVTSTSFTAQWNSVSSATSYDIQLWIEGNGNSGSWETQGNTSRTSYSFSGFRTNSTQWWRVRANNREGSSSYSNYRTVELSGGGGDTLPLPTGIRSDNYSSGFYIVWNTISEANQYEIQLKTNGTWTTEGTSNTYYFWVGKKGNRTSYEYRLRSRNGSATSDWSRSYTANLPSFATNNFTESIKIFPNSVQRGNDVSIHYTNKTDKPVSVTIYNLNGVVVKNLSMTLKSNTIRYNTSNLHSGMYYVKIKDGMLSQVKRLIVR